ncbi:hypothetical protein PS938_03913 [Pseudomonas fluorescens]|uniref:Uncharacterized protein n=1 Tax=Pseudomonas fluorescens TaxID=294 RepID=A0A5E7UPE0_PSEFL|nr:hypothetical protein PS938_03913 [Pseudomonas fluorescens]
MPISLSVCVADRVKSRSKSGVTPLADAATETNRLLKRQMAEMFKAGFPFSIVSLISQFGSNLL